MDTQPSSKKKRGRPAKPRFDKTPLPYSLPRFDETPLPRFDETTLPQSLPRFDETPLPQSLPIFDETPLTQPRGRGRPRKKVARSQDDKMTRVDAAPAAAHTLVEMIDSALTHLKGLGDILKKFKKIDSDYDLCHADVREKVLKANQDLQSVLKQIVEMAEFVKFNLVKMSFPENMHVFKIPFL